MSRYFEARDQSGGGMCDCRRVVLNRETVTIDRVHYSAHFLPSLRERTQVRIA